MRHTWVTQSQGSFGSSGGSSLDIESPKSYRVVVLGAEGVGKTSLIKQFMTSEFMGNEEPSAGTCSSFYLSKP